MALTGKCWFCGDPTDDWDYLGDRKVGLCAKRECASELRDGNRAIDEEAQFRAIDDNFDRYR
jgi:hypothetical protein